MCYLEIYLMEIHVYVTVAVHSIEVVLLTGVVEHTSLIGESERFVHRYL